MPTPHPIPRFLLPGGLRGIIPRRSPLSMRPSAPFTTSTPKSNNTNDPKRTLSQPDKFRPPSHPARRVVQTRNGKVQTREPVNYPGPKLSDKEREAQKNKQYPHMFPPEGTVMFKFLTSRWIHIWIAMGVLTTLATFTFTTNFRQSSPFAHLLPAWSDLLTAPFSTVSRAMSVFRMHVQHTSVQTREKRMQRVEDAEKRRQYRVAHGLEEPAAPLTNGGKDGEGEGVVDEQSPVAQEGGVSEGEGKKEGKDGEYVDWEGKRRPVKKWLGIW
ncbi:hypothetical protein P168DRAFT_274172 [Aspergillus campestris IBT 28561]|uniref:Uncharacterized protein n=1 Tax=Aspergillus campestris (strain IBT 28561) TaxID=1392248 RepID=A0A2I1CVK1_ASPC2|nr:uncharacterized protein P168DRAFT_274172 [Aspergillus campestris IBT 28561]PKY01646.1 hypothetical protein P168DRAFT_274172 [Aspergillus campestris IBT 28561]